LYCSVDSGEYSPIAAAAKPYDLGYLGTYSADRQPLLQRLLIEPALRRPHGAFQVCGAQYPRGVRWPQNVTHSEHLAPAEHRSFYNGLRLTLNITRADMVANGYSPSVRLFEAAACGVPIITDEWPGLRHFFIPHREILVAQSTDDVLGYLELDESTLGDIANRARARVLVTHTATHRAQELESYVEELLATTGRAKAAGGPVLS
jgi:spore maturation protein CgeB